MTDSNHARQTEQQEASTETAEELGPWQRVLSWFGALPMWSKALFGLATSFLILGIVAFAIEDAPPASAQPVDQAQRQAQRSEAQPGTQGQPGTQRQPETQGQPETLPSGLAPESGNSFLPGPGGQPQLPGPGQQQDPAQISSAEDAWSAGFFRLGFSFFAGFSIGLALRSMLRLLTIGIGIALLFLMVLGYFEFIEVNWDAFDNLFESLGDRIAGESERFRSFITGSLPSAGLAATGLTVGLRRRR